MTRARRRPRAGLPLGETPAWTAVRRPGRVWRVIRDRRAGHRGVWPHPGRAPSSPEELGPIRRGLPPMFLGTQKSRTPLAVVAAAVALAIVATFGGFSATATASGGNT